MKHMEAWIRLMLRAAPRAFRDDVGAEFLETYRERARVVAARGGRGAWSFHLRELTGVLMLVVRLRLGDRAISSATHEGRKVPMLETVMQDCRFAVRTLRRNPGYTGAAMLVLALGMGPVVAMLSVANAFFFQPLPFHEGERLVMAYETNPEYGWTHESGAAANVLDWRAQVPAFEDVAMYIGGGKATSMLDGEPTQILTATVTGNFFSLLGVRAALGRTLRWEETWNGSNAIVLSHTFWVTRFGEDPNVIGRVIEFGDAAVGTEIEPRLAQNAEIVGVMPEGFTFPDDETQAWRPFAWRPEYVSNPMFRRMHSVQPIARLKRGATIEEANTQLQAVALRLQSEYPATNRVMGAGLMPLRAFLNRDVHSPVFIFSGAVALLLLLACANVANLSLVRAMERSREVALRHALGAGRWRVSRLIITESMVLAFAGGAIGLALGWAGVTALARYTRVGIAGATTAALDWRLLAATFVATTLTGMLFGLAPAFRSAVHMQSRLAQGNRGGTTRGTLRTTDFLVAAEVALALLLVLGAGLMTRSYQMIRDVDPGFRTDDVLAVQINAPSSRYPEQAQLISFFDRLTQNLGARPGIRSVGVVGQMPLAGGGWSSDFRAQDWPAERIGTDIVHRQADRGYFDVLAIPLIRGRMFDARDRQGGPLVVLVNETFVRQHFANEDPIGKRIAYEREPTPATQWYEIIGIVADHSQRSLTQPVRAEVYEHRDQEETRRTSWIVLHTGDQPMNALPTVRAVLAGIDPAIPVLRPTTMQSVWRTAMAREEFILMLLALFGGIGLLMAAAGVYAVGAQAARRRTSEIGIRMALGARASTVVLLMLRKSILVVGAGLVAGLALSFVASRALVSVLYGVAPTDPLTITIVIVVLCAVAGTACYIPARRATRADPAWALRE